MPPNLQLSFWKRMGLEERDCDTCLRAVQAIYPDFKVEEFRVQGYCSFTFLVSDLGSGLSRRPSHGALSTKCLGYGRSFVVQLRPDQHALDLSITRDARKTYGSLVPEVRRLHCELPGRLRAYEMDMMHDIPFSRCQPRSLALDSDAWVKQVNLVESFAVIIARSWPSLLRSKSVSRAVRADSPIGDCSGPLASCTGKVGANVIPKLTRLAQGLPNSELQKRAAETLFRIQDFQEYPIVLNHGDLIPSNILVSPTTFDITGLVDWAEAEYLPFGMSLYGLEHLLGFMDHDMDGRPRWRYYEDAVRLRKLFWEKIVTLGEGLEDRLTDVRVARDAGVLLWYGYAWDEGRIDRVVNEADDRDEVECLTAFLNVIEPRLSPS